MKNRLTILLAASLVMASAAFAQGQIKGGSKAFDSWPKHEFSILSGLTQPLLLQGGNIEVNYYHKRWVFEYSHGFGLRIEDDLVGDADQLQNIQFRMPYSTGGGVGYRFTRFFDVRLEPKLHQFDVSYNDANGGGSVGSYRTVTVGIGAYYRWMPFINSKSWAKGISIVPAARYWPNVWTSLDNDELRYQNRTTGRQEVHKANEQGFGGFVFNLKVGYSFGK